MVARLLEDIQVLTVLFSTSNMVTNWGSGDTHYCARSACAVQRIARAEQERRICSPLTNLPVATLVGNFKQT
jgi:hypothetical protein